MKKIIISLFLMVVMAFSVLAITETLVLPIADTWGGSSTNSYGTKMQFTNGTARITGVSLMNWKATDLPTRCLIYDGTNVATDLVSVGSITNYICDVSGAAAHYFAEDDTAYILFDNNGGSYKHQRVVGTVDVTGKVATVGYVNAGVYNNAGTITEFGNFFVDMHNVTVEQISDAEMTITNSSYNMTSDGGCTNWTTTPRGNCDTTDGTPTITFSTTLAANCSFTDTDGVYNNDYRCQATSDTDHICTLSSAFKLDFGESNLYAQCLVVGSGQQYNSTALPINMTAGGGGGSGLVSCIKTIGDGCGVSIEDNCAVINQ